jgi:hypothetical protein
MSLGGKELYAARAAQAELANRQARLNEESEKSLQAIDSDFALLQSATLRIVTGQSEQQAAQIVLLSVREQIKNGRVGSLLEALDANEKYFNSRQRLIQTLAQQIQAQAQILRRIGVLGQIAEQAGIKFDSKNSMGITNAMPPVLIKAVDLKESQTIQKTNVIENSIVEKNVDLNEPAAVGTLPAQSSIIQINEINIEGKSLPNIDLPGKDSLIKKD